MTNSNDPLDGLPTVLRELSGEVRELWRRAKRLGDKVGDAFVALFELLDSGAKLFAKHGSWALLLATAAGAFSPITHGYGIDSLSSSTVALWSPLGALPLAVAILWAMAKALEVLDREGRRDAARQRREARSPELERKLDADASRRDDLNARLKGRRPLPRLDKFSFASDLLSRCRQVALSRDAGLDLTVALLVDTKKRGFVIRDVKGRLDWKVEEAIELGHVHRDVDEAMEKRLEPFSYRHRAIGFEVGTRKYLLLALSGETIPERVAAELSSASVSLLEEYVWRLDSREEKSPR